MLFSCSNPPQTLYAGDDSRRENFEDSRRENFEDSQRLPKFQRNNFIKLKQAQRSACTICPKTSKKMKQKKGENESKHTTENKHTMESISIYEKSFCSSACKKKRSQWSLHDLFQLLTKEKRHRGKGHQRQEETYKKRRSNSNMETKTTDRQKTPILKARSNDRAKPNVQWLQP